MECSLEVPGEGKSRTPPVRSVSMLTELAFLENVVLVNFMLLCRFGTWNLSCYTILFQSCDQAVHMQLNFQFGGLGRLPCGSEVVSRSVFFQFTLLFLNYRHAQLGRLIKLHAMPGGTWEHTK